MKYNKFKKILLDVITEIYSINTGYVCDNCSCSATGVCAEACRLEMIVFPSSFSEQNV